MASPLRFAISKKNSLFFAFFHISSRFAFFQKFFTLRFCFLISAEIQKRHSNNLKQTQTNAKQESRHKGLLETRNKKPDGSVFRSLRWISMDTSDSDHFFFTAHFLKKYLTNFKKISSFENIFQFFFQLYSFSFWKKSKFSTLFSFFRPFRQSKSRKQSQLYDSAYQESQSSEKIQKIKLEGWFGHCQWPTQRNAISTLQRSGLKNLKGFAYSQSHILLQPTKVYRPPRIWFLQSIPNNDQKFLKEKRFI